MKYISNSVILVCLGLQINYYKLYITFYVCYATLPLVFINSELRNMSTDRRLKILEHSIESYTDFPKKGVNFKDLFGVMRKPEGLEALMSLIKDYTLSVKGEVDVVVALDARGFLFGPYMAFELKVPFVPVSNSSSI